MSAPLVDTSVNTVVDAYLREIYCSFPRSHNILSHNGREFKNSLFPEIASQLGIKEIYCHDHAYLNQIEELRHHTNS